ncbi:hypothetical protein CEXT_97521 [Caerostris extrusa]|uniref:Uncharacterized protein n=1 Tax=Caerostris extrusa TaxID=172846 RepID=A0AAV4VFE2_CAEEX|nr:hypothetical protein CEXT_97521 [Caerostris extrusa]
MDAPCFDKTVRSLISRDSTVGWNPLEDKVIYSCFQLLAKQFARLASWLLKNECGTTVDCVRSAISIFIREERKLIREFCTCSHSKFLGKNGRSLISRAEKERGW